MKPATGTFTFENTVKKGLRIRVFLNGQQIKNCAFADTIKGKVRHYDDPPKCDKYRKRAIQRTKYGKVEVFILDQ